MSSRRSSIENIMRAWLAGGMQACTVGADMRRSESRCGLEAKAVHLQNHGLMGERAITIGAQEYKSLGSTSHVVDMDLERG